MSSGFARPYRGTGVPEHEALRPCEQSAPDERAAASAEETAEDHDGGNRVAPGPRNVVIRGELCPQRAREPRDCLPPRCPTRAERRREPREVPVEPGVAPTDGRRRLRPRHAEECLD